MSNYDIRLEIIQDNIDLQPDYEPLTGGVVGVRCACCSKWIIINRHAYDGDLQFCRDCMELPQAQAETMIITREEEIWQPGTHNLTQYLRP